MILVDTNVVSEPMRPTGNPAVERWLNSQSAERLFLSAVSLGEVLAGIAIMPIGHRRENLELALERLTTGIFANRILAYDEQAVRICATVLAKGRSQGIVIAGPDAQIAATAIQHGMIVATRDAKPFRGVGLRVINPRDEN